MPLHGLANFVWFIMSAVRGTVVIASASRTKGPGSNPCSCRPRSDHSDYHGNVFFKYFFNAFIFHKHTQWQCTLSFDKSTTMYKDLKPYTLVRFEPGVFWSWGGHDDHYATPPGLSWQCQYLLTYISKQITRQKNDYFRPFESNPLSKLSFQAYSGSGSQYLFCCFVFEPVESLAQIAAPDFFRSFDGGANVMISDFFLKSLTIKNCVNFEIQFWIQNNFLLILYFFNRKKYAY
jgi:hypothetical protein